MASVMGTVVSLAQQMWSVLIMGFIVVLSLVMLAHTIRSTVAVGMGSGIGLAEAAWGLVSLLAIGLFLFLAVPAMLKTTTTISACSSTLADLTKWSQRLLVTLMAFRMLKAAYLATFAEAVGSGEAIAALLNEAAMIIAAILFVPFIGGIATALLGC